MMVSQQHPRNSREEKTSHLGSIEKEKFRKPGIRVRQKSAEECGRSLDISDIPIVCPRHQSAKLYLQRTLLHYSDYSKNFQKKHSHIPLPWLPPFLRLLLSLFLNYSDCLSMQWSVCH